MVRISSFFVGRSALPALGLLSALFLAGHARALEPEIVEAVTEDGITLRMAHYPNEGGIPVILQSAFTTNYLALDLPVESASVARWFHDQGFDVYVSNLRGHGEGAIRSESPAFCDWTIDDFIAYDVDAVVERVTEISGRKPFWIGHSMGGIIGYGYLMGATYRDVTVDRQWVRRGPFDWDWVDVKRSRIVRDDVIAVDRQEKIAGLVTVASPPRIAWPYYVTWLNWPMLLFERAKFSAYNLVVDQLVHDTYVQIAIATMTCIPIETVTEFLTDDIRDIPFIGELLAVFLEWVFDEIGTSFLTAHVIVGDNVDEDVLSAFVFRAIDNASGKVTQQFMQSARKHGLRAFDHRDALHDPFRYGQHMGAIEAPILFVSGGLDKIGNPWVIRAEGFDAVSSADRELLRVPGHGHGDLTFGRDAFDYTWGPITNWINDRASLAN